jgi:hypothetical protein
MIVTARYVQRSICLCGFGVLYDAIPLGKLYQVDLDSIKHGRFVCGSCGTIITCDLIMVPHGGWMPMGILELVQETDKRRGGHFAR